MKKKTVMTMIIVGSLMFLPFHVNAEINDAEQRIINVVSANYSFNGKTYQITDEYKEKVREYLDREDINMTDDEASDYITRFYNNLSTAIEGGYMEEVKKTASTSKPSSDNNKDNSDNDNNSDNSDNNNNNNKNNDNSSNSSDSSEQDVIVIDPNKNYTVNDDGTVVSEEKTDDSQPATLEELAGEYSVSMDKIKEIQQEILAEQEQVTVSEPLSEEELNEILEAESVSQSPSASAKPSATATAVPSLEPSEEPSEAAIETAAPEGEEETEETKSSSGAGIIAAVAAVVLIAGGGIFAFVKKKKSE